MVKKLKKITGEIVGTGVVLGAGTAVAAGLAQKYPGASVTPALNTVSGFVPIATTAVMGKYALGKVKKMYRPKTMRSKRYKMRY